MDRRKRNADADGVACSQRSLRLAEAIHARGAHREVHSPVLRTMTVSTTITRRAALIAALLTALAMARMATTFRVFSATTDEAMHVAAGLEIYQFHTYRAQRENPPLPRLVIAAAPYL